MVTFRQMNFVEQPWPVQGPFDLIFCRNVMIYFNATTQRAIVEPFAQRLRPDGYLFIGHSETLNGLNAPLRTAAGTIYRRRAPAEPEASGRTQVRRTLPRSHRGRWARPLPAPGWYARPRRPQPRSGSARRTLAALSGLRRRQRHHRRRPRQPRTGRICARCWARASVRAFTTRSRGSAGSTTSCCPTAWRTARMPTRYGVNAMEMLINEVLKLGGDRRRLQAKAFGAAHVLSGAGLSPEVPRKNARFIKEFLADRGHSAGQLPARRQRPGRDHVRDGHGQGDGARARRHGRPGSAREEEPFRSRDPQDPHAIPDGSVELF